MCEMIYRDRLVGVLLHLNHCIDDALDGALEKASDILALIPSALDH